VDALNIRTARDRRAAPAVAAGCAVLIAVGSPSPSFANAVEPSDTDAQRSTVAANEIVAPNTADLSDIRDRNFLRVLVSYSRTNYFLDRQLHAHGFEKDLMQAYGDYLNRDVPEGSLKTHVVFVPVPFDGLIPALLAGKGDVIAAQLTVTPAREARVAFTAPYIRDVAEVLVTHDSVVPPTRAEELAGRSLYLLRGSSYAEHARALSDQLAAAGKPPIEILEASENLATEDILEFVSAGVVEMTIADSHLAGLWQDLLPRLRVHPGVSISTGGTIAWAVRKENPELLGSLNGFVKEVRKGTLLGNILFKRYYRTAKWIRNPLAEGERKKLLSVIDLFIDYARRYDFDYVALLALAYQESTLDHTRRSKAGAVGIMQIKKATAADRHVGIPDIEALEDNIHAGTKYLDWLRRTYFSGPEMSEVDRVNFSFAAYNAGPGRIAQMRRETAKRGLDPNKWFKNVEFVVRERVGPEPVGYVKAIHKYYVAYKLLLERKARRLADEELRRN
jgi:membrane-bound lytic murein transglycosylase MltF